jgi:transcription elongation factor GreB
VSHTLRAATIAALDDPLVDAPRRDEMVETLRTGGRAVLVDNAGKTHDRVYFGATVTVADESGGERTVSIVGVDELDPGRGRVSWISPIATALLKAQVGDVVTMRTPRGPEELEIIAIRYDELP